MLNLFYDLLGGKNEGSCLFLLSIAVMFKAICTFCTFFFSDADQSKSIFTGCVGLSWLEMLMTFLISGAAMGLPNQRVPAEEAYRQRGVLHRGDQDDFRQGIRHGVPGKR